MKKNWMAVGLAAVIVSSCLAGCGNGAAQKTEDAAKAVDAAAAAGEKAFIVGRIEEGAKGVTLC